MNIRFYRLIEKLVCPVIEREGPS